QANRANFQRVCAPRISYAQCRPAHYPRDDYRTRLESFCTNVVDVYVNYSTSQVDKRKVGQLAMAIQVAFQKLGVFHASTSHVPVDSREPMPFSAVQAVENAQRRAPLGRIVSPSGSDPSSA